MAATGASIGETATSAGESTATKRMTADDLAEQLRNEMGEAWIPRIYRERILTLRTRSHKVVPAVRGAIVEVQHTLLGIELKVGRKRISCPDLATARYLSVFARVGCSEVAVPYDITRISHFADDLESSWQRMILLAEHLTEGRGRSFAARVRANLVGVARRELELAGPGTAIPQFNQNTKQRKEVSRSG